VGICGGVQEIRSRLFRRREFVGLRPDITEATVDGSCALGRSDEQRCIGIVPVGDGVECQMIGRKGSESRERVNILGHILTFARRHHSTQ
jgi:hypothetical protein